MDSGDAEFTLDAGTSRASPNKMIAFVTLALSFQVSVTCPTATLAASRAASACFCSQLATSRAAAAASAAQSTHPC